MLFDAKCAPSEDLLVWYFYNGLRPSIKLWIDKEGWKLDGWEELIKKATKVKVKAKMQLTSSHDMDQRSYYKNRPVYASLNKSTKDSKIEVPKQKDQELKALNNSLRPDQGENIKTSDKAWKEKKKYWRREK